MEFDSRVAELWSRASVRRWPHVLALVSLPHSSLGDATALVAESADRFAALVVEHDEVSLTIDREVWASAAGRIPHLKVAMPLVALTIAIDLDLDVCGFLLPAARRLADAGVSIIPQCAFLKDHLVVHESAADVAVDVLETLIADASAVVG